MVTTSIQLLKPEEVASSRLARWGIYGKNGAGKTYFLRSIPQELPTLVVSADEENVDPLKGLPHIRVVKVNRWSDVTDVFLYLQDKFRDPDIASWKKPFFRVIAFDTYTRIQGLALNFIVGYDIAKPGEEAKYVTQAPRLPKGYDAWQQIGALAGEWMRYFQRLPIHTIFLFQETTRPPKTEYDDIETGPALTPQALYVAKDTLKIVGRLYVVPDAQGDGGADDLTLHNPMRDIVPHRKEKRMLLVGSHERYFAKGPTHILGYTVEDPTWDKLAVTLQ